MCGIVGIIDLADKRPTDKSQLKQMIRTIDYRGPDHEDYFLADYCGLGHCRLSIIDLSASANQPLSNEDGNITIVFNGEIYNFLQLRERLIEKGHVFKSKTDTEIVVHAYEEYGEDCVKYLNGMFAFAIWDAGKKQLFMARDRIGKKPLFYWQHGSRMVFASEMKAILSIKEKNMTVDKGVIPFYLTWGTIPGHRCIYKEISKLLPGNHMTFGKDGTQIKQYWDLEYSPKKMSDEYCCKKIMGILKDCVKSRMISDVPFGALLSGGIDSSAIVAIASEMTERPLKTFTIGYHNEENFDESKYAEEISELFSTDHHKLYIDGDSMNLVPKLVWLYNEPYANPAMFPAHYVAHLSRKHVTMVLNGDGGDEAFAGYYHYTGLKYLHHFKKIPPAIRWPIKKIFSSFPDNIPRCRPYKSIKNIISLDDKDDIVSYIKALCDFDLFEKDKDILLSSVGIDKVRDHIGLYFNKIKIPYVNKLLYTNIKTYLPDEMLVKGDISTMGNSLEARSPFLDHRILEFSAKIHPSLQLKGIEKKHMLKKALKGIIPGRILNRPKLGFAPPFSSWFNNCIIDLCDNLFAKSSIHKYGISKSFVKKLLANHKNKKKDESQKLWNILCLEFWHKTYENRDDTMRPLSKDELFSTQ